MKSRDIKSSDLDHFVAMLRGYARANKLGKPEVIADEIHRGFLLRWDDHQRACTLGDGFTANDYDRLIAKLKKW